MTGQPPEGTPPRVAVLGATGFGRFHAQWWTIEGAEVCAFLGRTPESVAATAEKLRPFCAGATVPAYTDLARLLAEARPDIVDVCTPPAWHYPHAKAALGAGCHVLCEKPFVYDASRPHAGLLANARDLAARAAAHGRLLGLCSQYSVAAGEVLAAWREGAGDVPLRSLRATLRSPAKGRPPDPANVWVDLGPHLLAALQAVTSTGLGVWRLDGATGGPYRATARLTVAAPGAPPLAVELEAGRTEGDPAHVRRLELNGMPFDLVGEKDAEGRFGIRIEGAGRAWARPDPMRMLIREFRDGSARLNADAAVENLAWTLKVLEKI